MEVWPIPTIVWRLGLTLPLLAAGGCGGATAKSSTPPTQPADSTHAQAWILGDKLSLAAVAHAEGAPAGAVDSLMAEAHRAAHDLGAKIAPLPARTGDRTRDSVDCLAYLLKTAGPAITNSLESRHGRRQSILFQASLKANMLHLLYQPSADGPESQAIVDFLADKATEADLPHELWNPLVEQVRSRAPLEEVKSNVRRMQSSVATHLSGNAAAAPSPAPARVPPDSAPPAAASVKASSSGPPALPQPPTAGERYLRTLTPLSIEALGGDDHAIHRPFSVQQVPFQNGVYIHPPAARSTGRATYDLGGTFARLRGSAGINDHRFGKAWSPVTFRILGDGQPLWTSRPLQACGASEAFDVPVAGVRQLTLEVQCSGDHTGAHGSWMDPVLSTK